MIFLGIFLGNTEQVKNLRKDSPLFEYLLKILAALYSLGSSQNEYNVNLAQALQAGGGVGVSINPNIFLYRYM